MKIVDVIYNESSSSYVDFSGFNKTITKIGSGNWKITPPLTSKTYNAIRITPNSKLSIADVPIAKYSHEREAFSINLYFKPQVDTINDHYVIYSISEDFGIWCSQYKVYFKIKSNDGSTYSVSYQLPLYNNSYHISATYNDRVVSLIVDGEVEDSIILPDSFKFKATNNLTLVSEGGTFLIDRVQILNEVLPIEKHRLELRQDKYLQQPGQVLIKDNPYYFGFDPEIKEVDYVLEYGLNKFFSTATITDLEEDENGNLISSTNGDGILEDKHFFPPLLQSYHNQIDWSGDKGITVEYSFDGTTYFTASNHDIIPNFSGGFLYYRITVSSDGKLSSFRFVSYRDKKFSSNNSLYELDTSNLYTVGSHSGLLINHSGNMGIRTINGGFSISDVTTRSVEFLYYPEAISTNNLIECGTAKYSFDANGTITKTGIQSIYVNGKNLTGETDISNVFTTHIWHHVTIVFIQDMTDPVFINQSSDGTVLGLKSRFAHLAIYNHDISNDTVIHYKYLTTKVSETGSTDTVNIGSESYTAFSVDKIVISTQ